MKFFLSFLLFINLSDGGDKWYRGYRSICINGQGTGWEQSDLILKPNHEFNLHRKFDYSNVIEVKHNYEGWWEKNNDTIVLKKITEMFCQTKVDSVGAKRIEFSDEWKNMSKFGISYTTIGSEEI